jgi:N-acetylneuraminic acid mutarotase
MKIPRTYLKAGERFDVLTNDWKFLPPMLEARICAAAGVLLDKLYVCGGSSGSIPLSSVEAFDPKKMKWEQLPPMPSARRAAACCAIGNSALCVSGGEDASGNMCSAMLFEAKHCVWTSLPDMCKGAWWSTAAVSKGVVYIFGGTGGGSDGFARPLERVECFNSTRMEWQLLPSMLQARVSAAAGTVASRAQVF